MNRACPRCSATRTRARRLGALACALAAAATLAAGCGDDGDEAATTSTAAPATTGAPTTAPATTAPPATVPATRSVTLYFSDDQGVLRAERREVPGTGEPLAAAVQALAEGPLDPSLVPALPPGTRVLGARTAGGEAVVDLSREFEIGYPPGGAAAELAVVGPIVRTAAGASGAARVRILVDGRAPAPTGSQFDFSTPFAPGDFPAP